MAFFFSFVDLLYNDYIFILLSTITLIFIYVYHYIEKKCLAIYKKYK